MSEWLDRWAKRAAKPAPPAAAHTPEAAADDPRSTPDRSSRRDFMKKAAVVGGAAWSVPVIQTALAPAASASPGSVIGESCSPAGVACGDGSICFAGICGGAGATCGARSPCFNSQCSGGICGGFNADCTGGKVCAPGYVCNNPGFKCKKQ